MPALSKPPPSTAAIRVLKAAGVEFVPREYAYRERGGTGHSAEALGVDEHRVIKTLVMESRGRDGKPQPLIVLMHGDREVSTRELARQIGAREAEPASAAAVEKHTGYVPGGVSPFGTRPGMLARLRVSGAITTRLGSSSSPTASGSRSLLMVTSWRVAACTARINKGKARSIRE